MHESGGLLQRQQKGILRLGGHGFRVLDDIKFIVEIIGDLANVGLQIADLIDLYRLTVLRDDNYVGGLVFQNLSAGGTGAAGKRRALVLLSLTSNGGGVLHGDAMLSATARTREDVGVGHGSSQNIVTQAASQLIVSHDAWHRCFHGDSSFARSLFIITDKWADVKGVLPAFHREGGIGKGGRFCMLNIKNTLLFFADRIDQFFHCMTTEGKGDSG